MASYNTLDFLRNQLVDEISNHLCGPCTHPRREKFVLNFEDPLNCPCSCTDVEPLMGRLAEVEHALKISSQFLDI